MMYSLPRLKTVAAYLYSQLFQKVRHLFRSKRIRYKFATVLDLLLIILILILGKQPAQRLVSPVVSSVHTAYAQVAKRTTRESFAFVPDLARNKFPYVDTEGLSYLSFFDVPLTEDGQINYDSRGYASFSSGEAAALFDRARSTDTKIFLTLSAWDQPTINNILENPDVATALADQAAEEIKNSNLNGITLDFELPQDQGRSLQGKFTNFVNLFSARLHNNLPQAKLVIAVPSTLAGNQSLYNVDALSKVSDRIFLIASNFIVPEVRNASLQNPVYGYNGGEYWSLVSNLLSSLLPRVSNDKLVMERAWYGNGDNYPLYIPANRSDIAQSSRSAGVALDGGALDKLVAGVPDKGQVGARKNIPLIVKALDREGILDSNVLAYALATIEHETDGTFEPIEEIGGRINARRLGYEGGDNYFGRGFIQITHLRNYRTIGQRIGMGDRLVKNPDLASDPEVAAKILAAFFKDNNVASLASNGDFVDAREPINPDYNGQAIAALAMKYEI